MPSNCIFCRIARGEIPCYELIRTETTLAFLDRGPLTRGHALVIPTAHAKVLEELPEQIAGDLGRTLHRLVPVITRLVGATGATVGLHNGQSAGQEVPHVHWHVVPRVEGDGGGPIHALFSKRPVVSHEQQALLAAEVRSALALGAK